MGIQTDIAEDQMSRLIAAHIRKRADEIQALWPPEWVTKASLLEMLRQIALEIEARRVA
jgi:hypothetical protein